MTLVTRPATTGCGEDDSLRGSTTCGTGLATSGADFTTSVRSATTAWLCFAMLIVSLSVSPRRPTIAVNTGASRTRPRLVDVLVIAHHVLEAAERRDVN